MLSAISTSTSSAAPFHLVWATCLRWKDCACAVLGPGGRNCTVLRCPACALSYLYLNQLSGTIPSSLGSLTGLTYLCVRRAAGRHCTVLRCPACAFSALYTNQLSGTIPSSLGSLTGLRKLCVCASALNVATAVCRAVCADASLLSKPNASSSQLPGKQRHLRHCSRWARAALRRRPACLPRRLN